MLGKQCTYERTDARRSVASRFAWLLKKIGPLSAADVTYLTRRSHKMTHKFDEHDATDLSRIIRRRRPHWNHNGIMGFLQQAALRGASLTQVMAAAEKTWTNQKATTPAAILWPEHWEPDKPRTAGNLMGQMLCVECTPARKHPVTQMTKMAHGWVCNEHQEEA